MDKRYVQWELNVFRYKISTIKADFHSAFFVVLATFFSCLLSFHVKWTRARQKKLNGNPPLGADYISRASCRASCRMHVKGNANKKWCVMKMIKHIWFKNYDISRHIWIEFYLSRIFERMFIETMDGKLTGSFR